ncbi:MAG: hypothetical protein ACRDTZ_16045 [Pseudonocardiaceae bacterium]
MRLPRISDLVASARGALALARVAAGVATDIAVNTGKRIMTTSTTPPGIPETLEALDGAMEVGVRLRRAMASSSAGGKQVTLEEILHSVSDGELRNSTKNLADIIETLVQRRQIDVFAIIPQVVEALLDWLNVLRAALQDRKLDPSELLAGVSTEGLRPALSKAIEGAEKIPGELKRLDFMVMMQLVNRVMGWLPQLLEEPK